MSGVRKWNLFLRGLVFAVGILVVGYGAVRAGVVEDQGTAFWPAFAILGLDSIEQPPSKLALLAAVQVGIWTSVLYLVFLGVDSVRLSSSRRP